MEIRGEIFKDIDAIRQVNIAAFGRENEANLVERLRKIPRTFSFVAVHLNQVVGHIFYSPVTVKGKCQPNMFILGLAPMAVIPKYQGQGIGSLLIKYSLEKCASMGCKTVVVLGDNKYYSRFGFIPAKEKGLKCEYIVPDEAFMVLELQSGSLNNCSGIVIYSSEFKNLEI